MADLAFCWQRGSAHGIDEPWPRCTWTSSQQQPRKAFSVISRAAELADGSSVSSALGPASGLAVGALLGLLFSSTATTPKTSKQQRRPQQPASRPTSSPSSSSADTNPLRPSCFAQLTASDVAAAGAELAGDFWLWRKRTALCEIMETEGSDKSTRHNYTPFYENIFSSRRDEALAVCEIGLGSNNEDVPSNMGAQGVPGASHRGWRQFFPNAHIYGGDVDSRVLLQEDRIATGFCDQTVDGSLGELLQGFGTQFDLLIDDGLHEFEASLRTLREARPFMRRGGIMVVEDVEAEDIARWKKVAPKLSYEWLEIIELPNATPVLDDMTDNCLIVVRVPETENDAID